MAGKMAIKPFKMPAQMDTNTAISLWKKLESSIDEIYQKKNSELSFEVLYRSHPAHLPLSPSLISFIFPRTGYNLVLQKHGDLLYRGVSSSFQSHTQQTLTEILSEPDEKLLLTLFKSWEEHRHAISMIRDIVMYLDRTYVCQQKLLSIDHTGFNIFRNVIINNSLIKEKLLRLLLSNIQNERNGELIDHLTMKGILTMLIELSIQNEKVYENEFETIFLFQTRQFYFNESHECLNQQSYSCIEYLTKVNQRYQEEELRLRNYLSKTTELKLFHILDVELLSNHAETLVQMERSGCQAMLHDNNIPHLKQLCQLFMTRVPLKLQLIRDCISQYIKKVGYEILADQEKTKEKPVIFVENILALKDKFDLIIQTCLQVRRLLLLYLLIPCLPPLPPLWVDRMIRNRYVS
jgi:cullin 3